MNRTIQTGDDIDSAFNFLGGKYNPPMTGEELFMSKIKEITDEVLGAADSERFDEIKAALTEPDKATAINKIREILGNK